MDRHKAQHAVRFLTGEFPRGFVLIAFDGGQGGEPEVRVLSSLNSGSVPGLLASLAKATNDEAPQFIPLADA